MNRIIIRNRAIAKSLCALLRAGSLTLAVAGLGACGGGGLAGDSQATDPGTVEYPIAYIQRPAPTMPIPQNEQNDLQDPFAFNPGAKLFVRSRADSNAEEINITDALFPGQEDLYDVKDLAVSPDGKNLVFALHAPMLKNAAPIDQPSWDIWVYNFATKTIRPVIAGKNKSEGSDVAPHFLADGRIAFVSDRQLVSKQQLASSGSPGYAGLVEPPSNSRIKAGVLHIMNADGTNIDQISYNQSHDLSPSQLRNGKLVFLRWDNMNSNNRMDLYTLNPSGSGLSFLYGYDSHNTGNDSTIPVQFSQPREMEDGRIVTILRPYRAADMGGDLVAIDVDHYSDNSQPTWKNAGLTGPAQQSLAANPVHIDGTLSPGGEFGAVWPLFDGTGRLLISWSQCRYLDSTNIIRPCTAKTPSNATPAPLLYGIWIFDPKAQTQKPIVVPKEGVIYTDIVAASPTKSIATPIGNFAGANSNDLLDYGNNIATTLASNDTAVLDIRSVYNLDGGIGNFGATASADLIANQANPANPAYKTRQARFLQIVQGVPMPDPGDNIPIADNKILRVPGFATGNVNYMRHIVGYAPIEADGSVAVQVPADVPITFNILNAKAQRISSPHKVWLQLRTGEIMRCTGCHSTANDSASLTHGRFDSNAPDFNPGTTASGYFADVSPTSVSFASTRVSQTMAEVYAANKGSPRLPSLNVYFQDEWATNAAQQNPTIDYRYVIVDARSPQQVPALPVTSNSCLEDPMTPMVSRWNSACRIVINYIDHIQKIWDKSRKQLDSSGNLALDTNGNPIDYGCTICHNTKDANGMAQIPAAQLDLTSGTSNSNNNYVTSFPELLNSDVVRDITGTPVQRVDNGVPVVDANGNPVFTPVSRVMVAGSARSSSFFNCFNGGTCADPHDANMAADQYFDHTGTLTDAELRLLSEWLDNGGQYYNDVGEAAAAQ